MAPSSRSFIVFKSKEINEEFKKDRFASWLTINPIIAKRIYNDYDLVIHFDADSLIVSKLDELLLGDYDVAGVRNNNDYGTAGTSSPCLIYTKNGIRENPEISIFKYLNAGLIASTKKEFWDEWDYLNRSFNANNYFQYEQDIYNKIVYGNKYNFKLLDPVYKQEHWGLSSAYGIKNHWETWKDIKIKDNELYLNNKHIRVLHQAGGSGVLPKMQLDKLFNKETQEWLKEILYGC